MRIVSGQWDVEIHTIRLTSSLTQDGVVASRSSNKKFDLFWMNLKNICSDSLVQTVTIMARVTWYVVDHNWSIDRT